MSSGRKASNLARIPSSWVPPYFVLGSQVLLASEARDVARRIVARCGDVGFDGVIIRSSADNETLDQRGRFASYEAHDLSIGHMEDCIASIQSQAAAADVAMAIVVQKLLHVTQKGHLSNERRVSATRNQWDIEVEYPRFESFRTNSQRDALPDTSQPIELAGARAIPRVFGAIGRWANASFDSRAHFEWVLEHDRLWLVQLDLEDDAPDEGVDPRDIAVLPTHEQPAKSSPAPFHHWDSFPDAGFGKVQSIRGFSRHTDGSYPDIYVIRADEAAKVQDLSVLARRLGEIVGDQLVCRTDIRLPIRDAIQGLNLPRTETYSPAAISEFMAETITKWRSSDTKPLLHDAIFLTHAYLPSVTGAWAEADPKEGTVLVDALWGLPDGLQYLDHDSFEFDLNAEQVVSEHIRYKAWFVAEEDDGSWRRKAVRRELTRYSSISREDVAQIAKTTHALAREADARLRVMWFVDVRRTGVAKLFPWFSHRPEPMEDGLFTNLVSDQSLLRSLPGLTIRNPKDLEGRPPGRLKLRLDPDARHMRDNMLIKMVADLARKEGHSVEVRGSGLCHAYYLLKSFGVAVLTPHSRRHTRIRGRQTFGKLVRDGIAQRIRNRGERVTYLKIPPAERRRALAAKLIEEAQEVAASTNLQDIASELADVLEIIRSIAKLEGIEWRDVLQRAALKKRQAGSFAEAIFLVETDIPSRTSKGLERRIFSREPFQPRRQDATIVIPFSSLMEEGVEFTYNGRPYVLRLRPEGVSLEELPDKDQQVQLHLPFGPA